MRPWWGGTILNMLNGGDGLEFARGGANRSYAGETIYLQPGNPQPPRSFQIDLQYRFGSFGCGDCAHAAGQPAAWAFLPSRRLAVRGVA